MAFNYNDFDGTDDYVEVPHNAAQLGANLSNGFTISGSTPVVVPEEDFGASGSYAMMSYEYDKKKKEWF
jgi:hypothetical protein